MVPAALLVFALVQSPEEGLLRDLKEAVASGNQARVRSYFSNPQHAELLWETAARRGGLRNFKVFITASPPGRRDEGAFWAVLSARHDIEEDHDLVYPLVRTADGLRLGREIPEWKQDPYRIRHMEILARLIPAQAKVEVAATVHLVGTPKGESPLFRLGLPYAVQAVKVDGEGFAVSAATEDKVARPVSGDAVKVGGLLLLWTAKPVAKVEVSYSGVLNSATEDKISDKSAYVTAWWVPSIGRLPHTTQTTVVGPKEWVLASEGDPIAPTAAQGDFAPFAHEHAAAFRCDIPISYPKIVAGKYVLAAERNDKGRMWRSYQLEPIDKARAERDVALIAEGVEWFEANLGPFPFRHYACFDADSYYGIESYSYTLLRRDVTSRFVTHEIGHTYFGGLVPCAYTKDSFNESLTQYVDSVLLRNNADGTLQAGLQTVGIPVPLTKMPVAHAYGSATYYRGAYVMRMLEHEIGSEAMRQALKEIVATRRGQETTWDDLMGYFVKVSKRDLTWFWDQWIRSADFPTIEISDTRLIQRDRSYSTFVTVRYNPARVMRTRFEIKLRRFDKVWSQQVVLDGNQHTYRIDTPEAPKTAEIDVFGLALAKVGKPVDVNP